MSEASSLDVAGSAPPQTPARAASVPDAPPASPASRLSDGGDAALTGLASCASPLVVLYVFSGPHLGAELELPEGRFLIGSDDSCDIILRGGSMAARHAAFNVGRTSDGLPEVSVTALDGPVRDGEKPDDSTEGPIAPAAGKAWHLGLTCLAWNRPGEPQPVLDPTPAPTPAPVVASPPGAEGDTEQADARDGNNVGEPLASSSDVRTTEAVTFPVSASMAPSDAPLAPPEPPRGPSALKRALLLAAVVICLGGLSVAVSPPPVTLDQYSGILEQKLQDAGLHQLRVVPFAQGVEVRGAVAGDEQLTALRDVARELHFPVYLDKVTVRSDRLQAVAMAFQARGFYPAVTTAPRSAAEIPQDNAGGNVPPASPSATEGDVLLVSAYIKDRLLEEGLFAALRDDVAGLPPIRRNIVHEDELAAALRPALNRAGLDYAAVAYLPGRVEISGSFGPDDLGRVRLVLDETGKKLGVPLRSTLRVAEANAPEAPAAGKTVADDGANRLVMPVLPALTAPSPSADSSAAAQGAEPGLFARDPLGGLRVTGVTMTPLRFVTTADGQRLFEGAMLPGGYMLETITTTTLILRKGGQAVTYKLRGAS